MKSPSNDEIFFDKFKNIIFLWNYTPKEMLVCVEMFVEPQIVNIVVALWWFLVVSVIWIEGAI